ncbi:MAG: DUF2027 domain-containing protein [Bernardetiaceae bacterium]|jgi:hypothetical protein|nr:DUF2027 domain-containing protein [Bernardetiaceae bacterium]
MNIGDRVRLVHHTQEGIVTAFLPNQVVEVEIEDGFKIPVLKNELVTIAKDEKVVFNEKKSTEKLQDLASKIVAESGFFLAFLPINDQLLSTYLVNNTDIDILFTLGETKDGNYAGLAAGHLTPRTWQKVGEANLGRFDKWSPLLVQALFFKAGFGTPKEPLLRKFTFVANTFFKSKRLAPGLGKEAFTFQVDQKVEAVNLTRLDADKLRESMTEPNPTAELPKKIALPVQRKNLEVDLHIEQLTPQAAKMNAGQMLELQLDVFEKQLDQAILQNANEITFIHGVGNGTLRTEIQKRLGRHPHVQFFQDARKERFGYGATLAKLK